jgi:hypothetical protein
MTVWSGNDSVLRAARSVLALSHEHLELMVAGTGAGVWETTAEPPLHDARLWVVGRDDLSLAAARNVGIRESKGEYVAFLESSDVFMPIRSSSSCL